VLLVWPALNAVNHAVVHGQDRLAPDLPANVHAAMTRAALAGTVARTLGAEHAAIAHRHPPERPVERVDPGLARDLIDPVLLPRWPRRARRHRLGRGGRN